MPDLGSLIMVGILCMAGGFIGGIVGVGGGVVFVPAMSIFLGLSHIDAEATSLLMIIIVGLAGAIRQRHYGNVNLGDAALVALLSPIGVAAGVVVANAVPERALELGFAGLCLFIAWRLIERARYARRPAVDAN